MARLIGWIDGLVGRIARLLKYAILIMIGLVMVEIASRLLFNQSFAWTRDIAAWIGAAMILLGGAYALQEGSFVRVDVVYMHLPPKLRAFIDLTLGTLCAGLVIYVLIRYGARFSFNAIRVWETAAAGTWNGPVWAAKIFIPLGGILMALAWVSFSLKNLEVLLGRRPAPGD